MRIFNNACAVYAVLVLLATPACEGCIIGSVTYTAGPMVSAAALAEESHLLEGVVYTDSLLRCELARLDSLYFSYGLLATEVTVDTVRRDDSVDLRMGVTEGERTVFGEVSISGSTRFTPLEIARRLGAIEGDPFDPIALGNAMQRLLADYNDAGYPYAQVWLTGFLYRSRVNRADISFSLFEGDRAVIGGVRFEGLTKTDTAVAMRTARLRPGSVYNERAVRRSGTYLRASGLFEAVGEVEVRRVREGAVDVVIPVNEIARSNRFQGAFGFSRKDGGDYVLSGSAEVELRNIAGSARDAMVSWLNDGQDYSRVEVTFREPFLLSSPVRLEVEVRQVVQDTIYTWHSGGVPHDTPRTGILDRGRCGRGPQRAGRRRARPQHPAAVPGRIRAVGEKQSQHQIAHRRGVQAELPAGRAHGS